MRDTLAAEQKPLGAALPAPHIGIDIRIHAIHLAQQAPFSGPATESGGIVPTDEILARAAAYAAFIENGATDGREG
jgi:peptide deformylase